MFRRPIDDLTTYDTFAAFSVVQYFCADCSGQLRATPDITPALPLFAELRQCTLATIAAAEIAANFAAVSYTDSPANGATDQVEFREQLRSKRCPILTA